MIDESNLDESDLDDDATLHRLLAESLEAIERGETIDRDQLHRDHPDHADALCEFLDNNALVKGSVLQLRNLVVQSPVDSAFEPTLDSRQENGQRRDGFRIGLGDRLTYIGEYEVISEIARGGMGIVFKARQTKLRRTVALKMILAGRLASETDVDRFHREARSAAALHHPNIVGVYEVGKHEGHHYFTMDFVESESLASIISGESLAPRRTAELLATIADAIHYAHGQGVLHRDLKPANVLVDEAGEPHVTDFGLAKTLADDVSCADLTSTGQILGTPGYMSPEQALAKHDLVSVASDVYSLGAVLYACLCSRAPFVADSAIDTIRQVIEKEPVSLRLLNPGVPKDLETICLKCLQKEPHRRYGTAGELADDLRRFLDGRPVAARPIARAAKAWRWAKRNPWVASLATLSVALLLTGTAVSTYFAYEAEQRAIAEKREHDRADRETLAARLAKRSTESALTREAAARGEAESARDAEAIARREAEKALANEQAARRMILQREREAKWNEYVARLTVIRQPWQDREYGHLTRMVDQLRPDEGAPDFRGWEWSYYADLVQHRVLSLDWSPDGEQLVSSDGVDVNSYPTRKKEGDIYSVRIWGTGNLRLIGSGPEMLPTALARALAPGNDRRAAETVLQLGGGLIVANHAEKLTVDRLEHLPPSDFQLLAIDLRGIGAVTDETLSRLHSLDSIQQLNLRLTEVSDDAVRSMLQSIAGVNLVDVDASHREFHVHQDGSIKPILTPDEQLARLTAAIAENPKDGDRIVARARWHAERLQWNDALADMESYLQLNPRSIWLRCAAAAAALMSGNMAAYRHHLMVNLKKLPDWDFSREADAGAYLAEIAAAAPDSIDDFSVLLSLATRDEKINLAIPYEAISLAMVEHRLGNHRRVLEILDPHRHRGGHHYAELILVDALRAVALHRLDRHDEAEAALDQAERVAGQAWPLPEPGHVPTYGNLKSFVMATKLLEEARGALNRAELD